MVGFFALLSRNTPMHQHLATRMRYLTAATLMAPLLLMFATSDALEYPASITLRAGVLKAPPFANYDDSENPTSYSGYMVDMLEQLQLFASEDGVDLKFELAVSPPQYGPAFDLVADDCNTTANPNLKEDCLKFDMIVACYYVNPDRSIRAKLTPAWMPTSMSTVVRAGEDYMTLIQASSKGASVCLIEGTYILKVVMELFGGVARHDCPTLFDCLEELKAGKCELVVGDEKELSYLAMQDKFLEMTRERFNYQYFVWAMKRYGLDPTVQMLMDKWIYNGVASGALDTLFNKYFVEGVTCSVGTAGENCELPCDPTHG